MRLRNYMDPAKMDSGRMRASFWLAVLPIMLLPLLLGCGREVRVSPYEIRVKGDAPQAERMDIAKQGEEIPTPDEGAVIPAEETPREEPGLASPAGEPTEPEFRPSVPQVSIRETIISEEPPPPESDQPPVAGGEVSTAAQEEETAESNAAEGTAECEELKRENEDLRRKLQTYEKAMEKLEIEIQYLSDVKDAMENILPGE